MTDSHAMKRQPLVVLDVGSTKVACLVVQPRERLVPVLAEVGGQDSFEVLGWGMAAYPTLRGAWPNDPTILADGIERALASTKLAQWPDRAVVALSHPALAHARVKAHIDIADEPVTIHRRHLQRLKTHALAQALGIDRDALLFQPLEYAGNGFHGVADPSGLIATRLSGVFQLVSIPISVRRVVMQALEAVGLETDVLVYSLQAAAAACLSPEPLQTLSQAVQAGLSVAHSQSERNGGMPPSAGRSLLIDIGGSSTDLAIVDQGVLRDSQTLAWGGTSVAEAVADACRLPREQALSVSLEGLPSTKPRVRHTVEQQFRILRDGLHHLLTGSSTPDRVVVTGRGALIDGTVEWVELMTERPTSLGRSPRASQFGELGTQLALSQALGLAEMSCAEPPPRSSRTPSRLVDRVLHRTRQLLVEYF